MQQEIESTPPTPAQLLAAARGFSAIYWGLLLVVLVMLGTLTVQLPLFARLPGHSLGLLLLVAGLLHLYQVRPGHPAWRRTVHLLAGCVLLQGYLIPFLGWWRAGTAAWYAVLNLGLLAAGGVLLLMVVPRLAQRTADWLPDEGLRMEARLCLWAVPVLSVVALGLILLWAGRIIRLSDPLYALKHILFWADAFALFPAVLPFIPALAMAWETKERCLRGLAPDPTSHTTPE